nr:purine-nucleoside phosphorylase [Effusibacillus dendaii]
MNQIDESASVIRKQISGTPKIGLVLGSGLGILAEEVENAVTIPYDTIPHFPVSTVEGHAGQFVFGRFAGQMVAMMQGRFHFYEGYSVGQVTFPIRVMKRLGIDTAVITNASGGINKDFAAGDLMLIRDHINLTGQNPLIGPNHPELGVRFPDMSNAYDRDLRELAHRLANQLSIPLQEGVYAGLTGPSYETPAEIRMLRQLGADAVGMSTVPEVIVAKHMGMRVLGISCISNLAAGILDQPLSHQEVMETAERVKESFSRLVREIVREL